MCRRLATAGRLGALFLLAATAAPAAVSWNRILAQPTEWYASDEARAAAYSVIRYQTETGGWPKNTDLTQPAAEEVAARATIDNGATTTPLRLLARVVAAGTDDAELRTAVERGLAYLLEAQYPNGGWPQYYPLRRGYYSHITYNDNAMVNVLRLLQDVAREEPPFEWLQEPWPTKADEAVARGVDCILRSQVRVEGQLTAWCAQHDAETLEPAPARNFEPVSLSGSESVGLLDFLMSLENPNAEVVAAVEAGVRWLREVRIDGMRVDRPLVPDAGGIRDQVLVADPEGAGVWARFYELGTNRPIFVGRDQTVHYDLAPVEPERRSGYSYYGTWGHRLLERVYPQWREKLTSQPAP